MRKSVQKKRIARFPSGLYAKENYLLIQIKAFTAEQKHRFFDFLGQF